MRVVTIKRLIRKSKKSETSTTRRSIRELARSFFAMENHLASAIEALLFALLLGAAAWPITAAAGAISELLQRVAS
jgi:hypothetical protein